MTETSQVTVKEKRQNFNLITKKEPAGAPKTECPQAQRLIWGYLSSSLTRFCTALAAKGFSVADFLKVVQPAGDTLVAVGVESVEVDAGAPVNAAVYLRGVEDRLPVRIYDTGSSGGVGVDEVGVSVRLVIRPLKIAVAKRGLERGERGDGSAVALELAFALLISRLDCSPDLLDGLDIALGDDEAERVFRCASVDGLGIPHVCVGPSCLGSGDNLGGIAEV